MFRERTLRAARLPRFSAQEGVADEADDGVGELGGGNEAARVRAHRGNVRRAFPEHEAFRHLAVEHFLEAVEAEAARLVRGARVRAARKTQFAHDRADVLRRARARVFAERRSEKATTNKIIPIAKL